MEVLPSYDYWNNLASNIALACWALGLVITLLYVARLSLMSDNKASYDFINRNEIKVLWISSVIMVLGACFYANSNIEVLDTLWITVRIFMTFAMGVMVALIVQNLLKFYYPFFIEKRLKVLRYKPRISPKTGKPMKLLSEEEEDAYLDEGMQAEENIFSTDYDVWKDEETGYVKIEKYSGHLHAIQCPECNYQTFKVQREEILKAPSPTEEGELMKHYQCGYCGHKARKTVVLKQQAKVEQSAATV
ncbi:MAG: hypothetical protein HC811_09845 [Flammeovirgaceae bacterium]|nr:hypothetical protein [Flammeovirgaceae bacterium]